MALEEKAEMMFINGVPVSEDGLPYGKLDLSRPGARMPSVIKGMEGLKMTHFNIWDIPAELAIFAKWYNLSQQAAEQTRLGIPLTITSNPRHHLGQNVISIAAAGFSPFCEMPDFAALGDEALVREFADIVRQECLAVGIREALYPQIDLATEPRWARISGNFSEDAELTARLVKPYIEGPQGEDLSNGVACMTKDPPVGGPQKEGLDPRFSIQKGQICPGNLTITSFLLKQHLPPKRLLLCLTMAYRPTKRMRMSLCLITKRSSLYCSEKNTSTTVSYAPIGA
jgi:beta-glucosidase